VGNFTSIARGLGSVGADVARGHLAARDWRAQQLLDQLNMIRSGLLIQQLRQALERSQQPQMLSAQPSPLGGFELLEQ